MAAALTPRREIPPEEKQSAAEKNRRVLLLIDMMKAGLPIVNLPAVEDRPKEE
jgi:hypothetical protein